MNLALDIGNTAVKWATFDGRTMTDHGPGLPADLMAKADSIMACASGKVPQALDDVPRLTADTPLPLGLDYKTPATLGPDRIADACGAWSLHPGKPFRRPFRKFLRVGVAMKTKPIYFRWCSVCQIKSRHPISGNTYCIEILKFCISELRCQER